MNIRELQNRLDRIEVVLPRATVYLWQPTEAEVRDAVTAKAQTLGIPESRIDVHTYRWLDAPDE